MKGDKEGATAIYLRLKRPAMNKGMNRGQEFDKYVEEYVTEHGTLPPELGSIKLQKPIPKKNLEMPYNDMLILKGEVDVLDANEVIEIKCSVGNDSADYSRDWQVDFYLFIASLYPSMDSISKIKKASIYRYDPNVKEYDKAIVYKSERRMKKVKGYVDRYGKEIYQYLQEEGVL